MSGGRVGGEMEGPPVKPKEFLVWPSAVAFGFLLAFVLILALPNGRVWGIFLVGPVLALIATAILFIACWVVIESIVQRRYRRAVSALIFPVLSILVALNFTQVIRSSAVLGDYVQFFAGYPFFRHAVARIPQNGGPRLVVFTTSGFISMSNGIAFDESDEIAKPVGEQSAAWKVRADHTELGNGVWWAKRILGHWYRFSAD
jgi:hypothetical protein